MSVVAIFKGPRSVRFFGELVAKGAISFELIGGYSIDLIASAAGETRVPGSSAKGIRPTDTHCVRPRRRGNRSSGSGE